MPAHRVPDQDHRQSGVGAARDVGDQVEVGGEHLSLGDKGALAIREPVAHVVRRVDRRAFGDEPVGDVVVAPRVLAVAVGEERDEARVLVRPLEEDEVAAGAGEGVLRGLGQGSTVTESLGDHLLEPGIDERTWIK